MLEQGAFVLHAASAWLAAQPRVDVFGTGFNALFFIASFGVLEGSRSPEVRFALVAVSPHVHGVVVR